MDIEHLKTLSVKNLKALAENHGISIRGCVEKADIVAALEHASVPLQEARNDDYEHLGQPQEFGGGATAKEPTTDCPPEMSSEYSPAPASVQPRDPPLTDSGRDGETSTERRGMPVTDPMSDRASMLAAAKKLLASDPSRARLFAQKQHDIPLCCDAFGTPRGACTRDCKCQSWFFRQQARVPWRSTSRSHCSSTASQVCECCGHSAKDHEDLLHWQIQVADRLGWYRAQDKTTRRQIPEETRLPVCASKWNPDDVAFYVLTLGGWDPSKVGSAGHYAAGSAFNASHDGAMEEGCLISVCVPTMTSRHHFHEMLWESFISQTWTNKELVIVDTGSSPSKFFMDLQRSEQLVYRYFNVEDAKDETQEQMQGIPPDHLLPIKKNMSLGMKRNLCAYLSRGAVIAHFDDDDMYAPEYLEYMFHQLRSAVMKMGRSPSNPGFAIATLSQWHLFDTDDMIFRWFDPKSHAPKEWNIDIMIYGFGFSYMYTRAAWERQPYSDVELSEDDYFMDDLRQMSDVLVHLVTLPTHLTGLCAHSRHPGSSTEGEVDGVRRLGEVVKTPKAFSHLSDRVNNVIKAIKRMPGHKYMGSTKFDGDNMSRAFLGRR
mmetsp:Transcript_92063/g.204323  ORF Transcript_92063/g.204323 Transcript_92063/m.204323 type:complete len:601 (+) Transcript_92063:77-1879(+)